MNKVGIIIQARMSATRLKDKVMINLGGMPVLWHVIERCTKANVGEVIVATSTNKENDVIQIFCERLGYRFFRGSENDVLDRYYQTAKKFCLDTVIRITGDDPLVSPRVINLALNKFNEGNFDYVSNVAKRTFPRGLDVEAFSFKTLEKIKDLAKDKFQREHVTNFIYGNPLLFKIGHLTSEGLLRRPEIRLCLDTPQDLKLLKIIYNNLYTGETISIEEVIKFLDKNPELIKINEISEMQQRNKNEEEGVLQDFEEGI